MKGLGNVLKNIEKHLAKANEPKIEPFNPIKKVEIAENDGQTKLMQSSLGFKNEAPNFPLKK